MGDCVHIMDLASIHVRGRLLTGQSNDRVKSTAGQRPAKTRKRPVAVQRGIFFTAFFATTRDTRPSTE